MLDSRHADAADDVYARNTLLLPCYYAALLMPIDSALISPC